MIKKYDFLLVGAGLFSAVFACEANKRGKTCLVVERRNHIGGNCYTEEQSGIEVHKYGAHIFRTSDKYIWEYINQFSEFNHFVNSPVANFHGEIFNLPFNMNTFSKMWGISNPTQAKDMISQQRSEITTIPSNLEEKAISLVGRDIYEKLIKGYSEKQWGRICSELPPEIIKRLPVRFTYDNNYYNDLYQGIPIDGYTKLMQRMFERSKILLRTDYISQRKELENLAQTIIYTGAIDEYYDYCYGELEYRSLRFEEKELDIENYQGVAVMNFTDRETPYTRIIEHKHFMFGTQPTTIVSYEYPLTWHRGIEPYYPINDDKNNRLYNKYSALAKQQSKVIFGGRLGEYKYYDMQDAIKSALHLAERVLS